MSCLKQEDYNVLDWAGYNKDTYEWDFKSFFTKTTGAPRVLSEYSKPVLEGIKVFKLLRSM